jgi:exopolysaccharide biosynthesis protein
MFRISASRIYCIIVLIFVSQNILSQINGFNKVKWQKEKIAPGLIWKSSHTQINDSLPMNINILIVNLKKRSLTLSYYPDKNIITSQQASGKSALAAVNAGFFNIRDGGSVTYIRSGGRILDADTAHQWSRMKNIDGSVLIDNKGSVFIEKARSNSWYDNHREYQDVLETGPMLLINNRKVQLRKIPFVTNRHPRTAIGMKGNKKIILVTLDGRTEQSRGMTLYELSDLMLSLRCNDAVNLDGGGSTTMWISGQPFSGIVNMPCDNRTFDHAGERKVSDILIIK